MKSTTVTIRSLYGDENIYFFVQYKDLTLSLELVTTGEHADVQNGREHVPGPGIATDRFGRCTGQEAVLISCCCVF